MAEEFPFPEPVYAQLARIGKALASPVRLRLLDLLDQRERSVEELAAAAGIGVKNASAQLNQLRATNLVRSRKEGTRVYYRLADEAVARFLGTVQDFAGDRLADLRSAVAEELGDLAALEPVTAEDLSTRMTESQVVVIDVRSADDYERGHIPGALSMPQAQLRDRLSTLPDDQEIVAYCQGPYCVASPRAVKLLREHGHQASSLAGGLARWRRRGLPVTESA
ncbi:ArsR family transcriptional regulator [Actinosynnema sp. ALI-1.44]|uniref:ArsR/SmtB family transcription factor n=1 Tax=Actinosynnema sp. ALI-1.44 TaxID=1933779 RepID=UPI00097C804F|nr:metalloregulator ArsR/SmtB family transcription factor [Actinosynnema sp. ALI-1.44]ONI87877.1 ArsR family transcriptional regulator [Actinosynnema sp. ALI-1.44]